MPSSGQDKHYSPHSPRKSSLEQHYRDLLDALIRGPSSNNETWLADALAQYELRNRPSPGRSTFPFRKSPRVSPKSTKSSPEREPAPHKKPSLVVNSSPKSTKLPPEKGSTVEPKYLQREQTFIPITPTELELVGKLDTRTTIFSSISLTFLALFIESLRAAYLGRPELEHTVGSFLLLAISGIAAYFFYRDKSTLTKNILKQVSDNSKKP